MLLSEVLSADYSVEPDHLAKSLATFDWYHEMSDDHRVWARGNEKLKSLRFQVMALPEDERRDVMKMAVRLSPSAEITKHITKLFSSLGSVQGARQTLRQRPPPERSIEDRQRGHIEGMARRGIEKIYFYDHSSLNFKREPDGSIPSHITAYIKKMLDDGNFAPKYENKLRDLLK